MSWPNRVWEKGGLDESGKQLWWSREVTPEDRKRRQEYEEEYPKRSA